MFGIYVLRFLKCDWICQPALLECGYLQVVAPVIVVVQFNNFVSSIISYKPLLHVSLSRK
jgi:hypothetical protein